MAGIEKGVPIPDPPEPRWKKYRRVHNYKHDPDKYRAYYEKKYSTPEGKKAMKEKCRKWREAHAEELKARDREKYAGFNRKFWTSIKLHYGMTPERYMQIYEAQKGKCAVCGELPPEGKYKRRLCIDHCHATGKIRALLCNGCNVALAHARESPIILTALIKYVNHHKENTPNEPTSISNIG